MNAMSAPVTPAGRPNLRSWQLCVVSAENADPNMRRVVFTADDIADFDYKPGQAIVFAMPLGNGELGRRHYTVRSFDRAAGHLAVDFLLHGEGPSPAWALAAKPGDTIEAKGPRGHTVFNADADWHVITGDETCIPAFAHMLETLPANARVFVFIETHGKDGEIDLPTKADARITWLHRGGLAGPGDTMLNALNDFVLPEGRGQFHIIGETSNVRRQRHALIERGISRDQISSEGYWRPGRIGGHDHVED
jgi:NADPH-dependent ferric siderophore reductase